MLDVVVEHLGSAQLGRQVEIRQSLRLCVSFESRERLVRGLGLGLFKVLEEDTLFLVNKEPQEVILLPWRGCTLDGLSIRE